MNVFVGVLDFTYSTAFCNTIILGYRHLRIRLLTATVQQKHKRRGRALFHLFDTTHQLGADICERNMWLDHLFGTHDEDIYASDINLSKSGKRSKKCDRHSKKNCDKCQKKKAASAASKKAASSGSKRRPNPRPRSSASAVSHHGRGRPVSRASSKRHGRHHKRSHRKVVRQYKSIVKEMAM